MKFSRIDAVLSYESFIWTQSLRIRFCPFYNPGVLLSSREMINTDVCRRMPIERLLLFYGVFFCLFAWSNSVAAQEFTQSIWRAQDGLPENIVQSLAEDKDGYLWIGTTGGLVSFDGSHFQPFHDKHGQKLPDSNIFCLYVSRDGSVWAGTEGGGVLRLKDGVMRIFNGASGLANGFVRSITEDEKGRIWVGTDNGLYSIVGNVASRVDAPVSQAPQTIHSIFEDHERKLWVGGIKFFRLGGGRQDEYTLPGSYSQSKIKAILETREGELWVGTVSGLLRRVGNSFVAMPQIHATVRTLRQTEDGTLWIGTIGAGLWRYRKNILQRVDREGLLPSNTVLSLYEDSGRRLWVGTQNGLVRLVPTPVEIVALPGGSDSDFGAIGAGLNGDVWMVSQGLYRIHEGAAEALQIPGLGRIPVRNLLYGRDGSLWVGTDGSGVYRLKNGRVSHLVAPHQLTNNFVRAFLETSNGDLWIATDEGANRVTQGVVQKITVADGLSYFSTRSLCEDRRHDIWIGADRGISHWRNGRFISDEVTQRLQQEKIWSIWLSRRGTLWFGTRDHGIYSYREGKIWHYTTEQGLLSNSVYQILQDKEGRFWISGADSVISVSEQDMEEGFPSADHLLGVTSYKIPFGSDGAQFYGGRQPSGFLARDGSLWFPTSKGAIHIQSGEEQSPVLAKMRLTAVQQDGHDLPISEHLDLPSGASRLVFTFAPIFLGSQDGIRFRYQLENFDKGWVFAGSATTATYTNLPAGKYRFRVVAFDRSHPTVATETSMQVTKAQVLYRTWWFLSLCVGAMAVSAAGAYRARLHRIQKSFAIVLEERSRLAREMHDTVIQGCTGVSALLEAMASFAVQRDPVEQELLDQARTQVVATIGEARTAVWNLRRDRESPIELNSALEGIAQQASKAFGIPVRSTAEVVLGKVTAAVAHELFMAVREAVANAGTHAKASAIWISSKVQGKEFIVQISDDGCGFSPHVMSSHESNHFGLTGMKERMHRIGGSFHITSALNQGTTVELRVKRSRLSTASAG